MNKKTSRSSEWKISGLASGLPPEAVQDVEPLGEGPALSTDRIQRLALEKRNQDQTEYEEKPMKKNVFRIALVAALVCVTTVTVFAATGAVDYIRRIFGDSALSIQNEIVTPHVSDEADGRTMAVEAMVTDGYITNIVVSLTGSQPPMDQLFQLSADMEEIKSWGYQPMDDISTKQKTYYQLTLASERRFDSATVTVALNQDVAPITLTFPVDNHLGNAVVAFPQGAMAGTVQLQELQISPMGFLLIGSEEAARGGLPSTAITLVFAGGATEEMDVEFDDGDGDVSGGGGVIMMGPGEQAPLVVFFQGERNPDGEIVISGQFSRIIQPGSIEKVLIDGVEYPVS